MDTEDDQAEWRIGALVGMRKTDDEGKGVAQEGSCRFIRWGIEGGGLCPENQCTWEPLLADKAPLEKDELEGKQIQLRCSSRWYPGHIYAHKHGAPSPC